MSRCHLVGEGHSLSREHGLQGLEVGAGPREVLDGLGLAGDAPVVAPGGDGVGYAAEEGGGVAGRKGDDVGTGDGLGAGGFESGLGGVDHLEAPEAQVVDDAVFLRRVPSRRVSQYGCITSLATLRNIKV